VRKEHQDHLAAVEARNKSEQEAQVAKQKKIDDFFSSLEKSSDLNDNLQQLVDFLEEQTGATGVYVGHLVH